MTSVSVQTALAVRANAKLISQFLVCFKTGVGQYGEDEQFIGVRIPDSRLIAKRRLANDSSIFLFESSIVFWTVPFTNIGKWLFSFSPIDIWLPAVRLAVKKRFEKN